MSDTSHMNPNLVGPSSTDFHFQVREAIEPLQDFVRRKSAPSLPKTCRHPSPSDWIARDRSGDLPLVVCNPALHEREVRLLYLTTGELLSQVSMCGIGSGHEQDATRFFVDSMYDSRPLLDYCRCSVF